MTRFNRIKLKVCGMRDPRNILEVAALGPDFLGFIFYRASSRYVGDDFRIPDTLNPGINRVGVFVDSSLKEMTFQANRHQLSHIQLHGNETPEQCAELKSKGLEVIKAVGIDSKTDFNSLNAFFQAVDYFLFDTKSKGYGGSGRRFDWKLLRHYRGKTPFILSGGIGPEHIREITGLAGTNLIAIDVNSSFEIEPGLKDVDRIRQLQNQLSNARLGTETVQSRSSSL